MDWVYKSIYLLRYGFQETRWKYSLFRKLQNRENNPCFLSRIQYLYFLYFPTNSISESVNQVLRLVLFNPVFPLLILILLYFSVFFPF